jgi:DNA-binding cell septation regulator SpoVG
MEISVIELRRLDGDKPLKAFVDLQMGDMIIREWRVIKNNGQRFWIAPPQLSWKGPDGRIQYKTIVTLPDELKGQVDFEVLKAFNGEMEKQSNGNRR